MSNIHNELVFDAILRRNEPLGIGVNIKNPMQSAKTWQLSLGSFTDAPSDWYPFKPLSKVEMYDLKLSIMVRGLLSPILAWQQSNEKYIILSGRNRVRVYKDLAYLEEDLGQNRDLYTKIPSIIYPMDGLTEKKARAIIIDSNIIQRNYSKKELAEQALKKMRNS